MTRRDYKPGTAVVADQFYRVTGSSFAAPIVSGAALLLLSAKPDLTAAQVKRMLMQSARDLEGVGIDQFSGYGLLDVEAALAADPNRYAEAAITSVAAVQARGGTVVRVTGTTDADALEDAHIETGPGDNPARWTTVSRAAGSADLGYPRFAPAALVRSGRRAGADHPVHGALCVARRHGQADAGRRQRPCLAQSWSMSEDGLSWDFVLRDGVKFHDGEPITAEDIKFSFERYRGANQGLIKQQVATIETPDARHVRFKLNKPWPDFLTFYSSASGAGWIVPKKYVEKGATAWPTRMNLRRRCRTGNPEEPFSGYRAARNSSFPHHHRATPRAAHLSRARVRYSCRVNIGNSFRP